uniref:Uncharacterized protein n=1 Tax=Toxoplasma gondii (strain ATCC 50861 / VEG) TaxID=432359 RepID=A0A0F7UPF4_TOXGV|nr:TPA: hypothetical protein BN1205_059015 [Toxoplasma gondii VEG]
MLESNRRGSRQRHPRMLHSLDFFRGWLRTSDAYQPSDPRNCRVPGQRKLPVECPLDRGNIVVLRNVNGETVRGTCKLCGDTHISGDIYTVDFILSVRKKNSQANTAAVSSTGVERCIASANTSLCFARSEVPSTAANGTFPFTKRSSRASRTTRNALSLS